MSTTFEKIASNKVKLDFTVPAEDFDKAMTKAFLKMRGRINIPGFRKGKAPRKVVEMQYGEGIFYDEAIDSIFPELYREAINEHGFTPVDRPELNISEIGSGKDCVFSIEVFVRPDVDLGDYKSIRVEREAAEVTDDDVKAEIERVRQRNARMIDITDRPVKLDDTVKIDYQGFCEGEQFEGGTAEGQTLVIGSGSFIPGFEEQLVGAEIGKEVEVNVTFPEEYHAEKLAGKPAVFKCTIRGIQEKELPQLDDEFAKDNSEFDTLAAYTEDVKAKLVKRSEDNADAQFENDVIEKLVDGMKADIPQAMNDDMLEDLMREMEASMNYQGLTMDLFCKYTNQTIDQVRESRRADAENRVKVQLALEALSKAENIEPTEEDIDASISEYAVSRGKTLEEYEANMSDSEKNYFSDVARTRKTVNRLKEIAKGE